MQLRRVIVLLLIAVLILAVAGCTKVKPTSEAAVSIPGNGAALSAKVIPPAEESAPDITKTLEATSTPEQLALAMPARTSTTSVSRESQPSAAIGTPTATPLPTPTPEPQYRVHVVGWGDTLLGIALAYGVPMEAIVAANDLQDNTIYLGQELRIPAPAIPVGAKKYTVQPGDSLFTIAERFGVDVSELMRANNLTNGYYLQVGQVLVIPGGSQLAQGDGSSGVQAASIEKPRTHTVQPGDTIFSIAAMYDVSPYDLVMENSLQNPNVLQVGQELKIP